MGIAIICGILSAVGGLFAGFITEGYGVVASITIMGMGIIIAISRNSKKQ